MSSPGPDPRRKRRGPSPPGRGGKERLRSGSIAGPVPAVADLVQVGHVRGQCHKRKRFHVIRSARIGFRLVYLDWSCYVCISCLFCFGERHTLPLRSLRTCERVIESVIGPLKNWCSVVQNVLRYTNKTISHMTNVKIRDGLTFKLKNKIQYHEH